MDCRTFFEEQVIPALNRQKNIVITGGCGVGKSTLFDMCDEYVKAYKMRYYTKDDNHRKGL